MANRILRGDIARDESLSRVSRDAALTYLLLVSVADDHGRFEARPRAILAALYPMRDDVSVAQLEGWLRELEGERLIACYSAAGGQYLVIPSWSEHQRRRETRPKYPDPPQQETSEDESAATCRNLPQLAAACGNLRQPAADRGGAPHPTEGDPVTTRNYSDIETAPRVNGQADAALAGADLACAPQLPLGIGIASRARAHVYTHARAPESGILTSPLWSTCGGGCGGGEHACDLTATNPPAADAASPRPDPAQPRPTKRRKSDRVPMPDGFPAGELRAALDAEFADLDLDAAIDEFRTYVQRERATYRGDLGWAMALRGALLRDRSRGLFRLSRDRPGPRTFAAIKRDNTLEAARLAYEDLMRDQSWMHRRKRLSESSS